jgi:hypothetical protein
MKVENRPERLSV